MGQRISNRTRGRILADRAEVATTFYTRFMGLMGRKTLAFGEGLLISPCNSIHTFFMRIAIDALFLDSAGRVLRVYEALPPWRVTAICRGATSVLELPAGTAAGSGTQTGDQIEIQALDAKGL